MKKWKVILTAGISVIVLAVAGSVGIYHYYIVPKYIEPMLETAVYILNDNSVKDEISQIAEELREQGLLEAEAVNEFIDTVKEGRSAEETQPEEIPPEEITSPQDSGRKYSYGKKKEKTSETEKAEKSEVQTASGASSGTEDLYERVKSQVSSEDLKKGYAFLGKLDMGTVRSLLSDRAALKKYIRNTLTSEEYAELIELYIKYSYLLNE